MTYALGAVFKRLGPLFVGAAIACAPPAPRVTTAKAPPPPPTVPAPRPPTTTILLHLDALRAGPRTKRGVEVATLFLPDGERSDDVTWLAVDGPSPLGRPAENVFFVQARSAPLRIVRGGTRDGALAPPKPPHADELLRIHVQAPKTLVRIPHYDPPDAVEELTIFVEARADGGADLHLRERCTDPAAATEAAASLDATIERWNGRGVGIVTGGLFADAKATVDGAEARLDIRASPDQVEAITELAAHTLSR